MHSHIDFQKNIKKTKKAMFVLSLTWAFLMSLVASWLLFTGRAQAYGKEAAAWITIAMSLLIAGLELYCYGFMSKEYDIKGSWDDHSRTRFFLRLLEVVVLVVFWFPAFITLIDSLLGLKPMVPSPYNWLGLILVIPGLLLNYWITRTLYIKGKGTPFPFDEPTQNLIIDGPYRFTRNPMGTAMLILYYGLAVLLKSYLLLIMITFSIFNNYYYITRTEEKEMEDRFGQAFLDYKARVPRFFFHWGKKNDKKSKNKMEEIK